MCYCNLICSHRVPLMLRRLKFFLVATASYWAQLNTMDLLLLFLDSTLQSGADDQTFLFFSVDREIALGSQKELLYSWLKRKASTLRGLIETCLQRGLPWNRTNLFFIIFGFLYQVLINNFMYKLIIIITRNLKTSFSCRSSSSPGNNSVQVIAIDDTLRLLLLLFFHLSFFSCTTDVNETWEIWELTISC